MEMKSADPTNEAARLETARSSHELLRKLIDGLGPHMFAGLMTPEGILIEANRPVLEAAGMKPEDVLGKPFAETYWWSYSEPVQQQLREAIRRAAAGQMSRYDVEVRVAENQLIWIDFSLQSLADETGKIVYLVPSANVITERKQAEEESKRALSQVQVAHGEADAARKQISEILDRVSDAFVALDTDWHYTYVNQKAAELFHRRPEELIGKHIGTEFPEGVGQPFYKA